jgi:hypothetical protein
MPSCRPQGEIYLDFWTPDQVPLPDLLDHTLGYFKDPKLPLVKPLKEFGNGTNLRPLGSNAPLFMDNSAGVERLLGNRIFSAGQMHSRREGINTTRHKTIYY